MHNYPLRHIFKSMFENMVIAKDVSLIEKYYHPEFKPFANSKTMNFITFMPKSMPPTSSTRSHMMNQLG